MIKNNKIGVNQLNKYDDNLEERYIIPGNKSPTIKQKDEFPYSFSA